jgi:hypothetical protein
MGSPQFQSRDTVPLRLEQKLPNPEHFTDRSALPYVSNSVSSVALIIKYVICKIFQILFFFVLKNIQNYMLYTVQNCITEKR